MFRVLSGVLAIIAVVNAYSCGNVPLVEYTTTGVQENGQFSAVVFDPYYITGETVFEITLDEFPGSLAAVYFHGVPETIAPYVGAFPHDEETQRLIPEDFEFKNDEIDMEEGPYSFPLITDFGNYGSPFAVSAMVKTYEENGKPHTLWVHGTEFNRFNSHTECEGASGFVKVGTCEVSDMQECNSSTELDFMDVTVVVSNGIPFFWTNPINTDCEIIIPLVDETKRGDDNARNIAVLISYIGSFDDDSFTISFDDEVVEFCEQTMYTYTSKTVSNSITISSTTGDVHNYGSGFRIRFVDEDVEGTCFVANGKPIEDACDDIDVALCVIDQEDTDYLACLDCWEEACAIAANECEAYFQAFPFFRIGSNMESRSENPKVGDVVGEPSYSTTEKGYPDVRPDTLKALFQNKKK